MTRRDRFALAVVFLGGIAQLVLWPHRTLRMLRGGSWEDLR